MSEETKALIATLREVHEVCIGCLNSVVSPRSLVEAWRRRVEAVEIAIQMAQAHDTTKQAKRLLGAWNHHDVVCGTDYDDCRRTIVDLCAVFGMGQPPSPAPVPASEPKEAKP